MKKHEVFPTPYLQTAHLDEGAIRVTIERVESAAEHDRSEANGAPQAALFFQNVRRYLRLSSAQFDTIAKLYGDETDDWYGKDIVIDTDEAPLNDRTTGETRLIKFLIVRAPEQGEVYRDWRGKEREAPPSSPSPAARIQAEAEGHKRAIRQRNARSSDPARAEEDEYSIEDAL